MSQSTWVLPIAGSQGHRLRLSGAITGTAPDTTAPGKHNYLATYVLQPIVFSGTQISLPTYKVSWKLDLGAGTWAPN